MDPIIPLFLLTLQMSSAHTMMKETLVERHQSVIEALYDTDEYMPTESTNSIEISLPLRTDGIGTVGKQRDFLSAECLERLVLLSSNTRSWGIPDDEAVDLTEPRLESFDVANIKSLREEQSHRLA